MGWLSQPKPDPATGQAAARTAQTQADMATVAREELAFGREQYDRHAPMYDQLMKQQIAQGDQNAKFSAEQLARYKQTFLPVEDRMVSDAMTYDSPDRVARREGMAANTVQGQFDASRGQATRQLGAMGVSPSSGRMVEGMNDDANALGLAKAGAINSERVNSELTGMQLRQGVANFGRGLPQQGLQASQVAIGANNSAAGIAGQQAGSRAASLSPALGFYGGSVAAGNSAANILNTQYQNQVGAWGDKLGAIGNIAGIGLRAWQGPARREHGGPVEAGRPYVVGEAGPEVIVPPQDGVVIPNHALKKVAAKKNGAAPAQAVEDARLVGLESLRM